MTRDARPRGGALVDLDGPLTRLFPHPAHLDLALALAARVREAGGAVITDPVDHVQVLREVARWAPDLLADLESDATTAEIEAARRARPATGAREFLAAASDAGYAVAVVSNNDTKAVRIALSQIGIDGVVEHIAGRRGPDIAALKPAPDLLIEAMAALGTTSGNSLFLGDSVSDMDAALAAGVRAIGVSSAPRRRSELQRAGAVAVYADLGAALSVLAPPLPPRISSPS